MTADSPPVIQLLGPTASGKSALAEAAATEFGLELVSVDSAQVYRGLDIGSAKPDPATRARIRHWLIDVCDPEQVYSAARFAADAQTAIADIHRRGKRALLVGGTGLYFRAFHQGLSELPQADALLRERLAAELEQRGAAALHAELASLDPQAAQRIRASDLQRLLRALEVIRLTGRSLSSQQLGPQVRPERRADLRLVFAPADRGWLHQRIAARLQQMFAAGFIDEVRRLRARPGLTPEHPAVRAVGYRQVWDWLEQGGEEIQMRERCVFATRQLAKRQFTWLRSEQGARWLDASHPHALQQGLAAIAQFLERG